MNIGLDKIDKALTLLEDKIKAVQAEYRNKEQALIQALDAAKAENAVLKQHLDDAANKVDRIVALLESKDKPE